MCTKTDYPILAPYMAVYIDLRPQESFISNNLKRHKNGSGSGSNACQKVVFVVYDGNIMLRRCRPLNKHLYKTNHELRPNIIDQNVDV